MKRSKINIAVGEINSMGKHETSKTWKQLVNLDPDTAEAAGWHVSPREFSRTKGWAVELRNPKGELVAWGYRPIVGNVADTIRIAQAALAERGVK